ncbi:MAG TPA: DUF4410 domain-containing protein [Geobacteraceae bacterium]
MKRYFAILMAAALLSPAFAAAGDLAPYSSLIVRGFSADKAQIANVTPDVEQTFFRIRREMVEALADGLVTQLKGSFPAVSRTGKKGENAGRIAVIEGNFTAIDAGRRGLRMWIGFSGTASATLQARIMDERSGKLLAVFEQERSAPLGWAGSEQVLLQITGRLAQDLAEFVKKLR